MSLISKPIRKLCCYWIYLILLTVYFPIYIFFHITVKLDLIKCILKKKLGNGKLSKFSRINRKVKVQDIDTVSIDEQIDFIKNRSTVYIHRVALWTPFEVAKMFTGLQNVPLISDQQLVYTILNSVFAHAVTWNKQFQMFHFVLEGLSNLTVFEGFYLDAREVLFSRDGEKVVIRMNNGKEYASDCTLRERGDFNQAKMHLQVCLSYYAPCLAHNHVHFVFPSSFCVLSKKFLKPNGILYKLLSPHFRFTESINHQALRIGKATSNKRSIMDKFFFFWRAFPITKEEFIEGVASKCDQYYYDLGSSTPEKENENSPELHLSSSDEDLTEMKNSIKPRSHAIFPPRYVTDKSLSDVPYLKFLKSYYMVVRKFVKSIERKIDRKEWKKLSEEMTLYVPKFKEVDMVDAITTFIHQVGVVHHCDHSCYLKYFARKYGCTSFRFPFEPYSNSIHWKNMIGSSKKLEDIMKNPESLVFGRDVMRTRCLLNVFAEFIENKSVPMQLVKTRYNFEDKLCDSAADEFITGLRRNDGRLRKKFSKHRIKCLKDEERAVGLQLVPLNEIIRSVCY